MSSSVSATSTSVHGPFADPNVLRTAFTLAMSSMYKTEVPLYGDLVRIVSQVNTGTLESNLDPGVLSMRHGDALGSSSRIDIERHGAIRLGTAQELRTIRRVFAIIGLEPVGYYDLTPAGLPMHATCFRPRTPESLGINPFRVFTSVLRPELIRDAAAKKLALHLLSKRDIFTPELMSLLEKADAQDGRLTISQGDGFIAAAMHTFKWHGTAASSYQDYMTLKAEHPVLADIACFRSAHINHLTPRTLDIVSAQEAMKRGGLRVKDRIEGPPRRKCPILLRQTSFLAIEEPIRFATTESTRSTVQASHRARFGEIEERGAAVTPRGRRLYDDLLEAAMGAVRRPVSAEALDAALADVFDKYPDSWDELRRLDLVYFSYRARGKSRLMKKRCSIDELLNEGAVEAVPITYEDFLPLSAAGIFQSNLGAQAAQALCAEQDVESMQAALGVALSHADDLYRCIRDQSVAECAALLGVEISGRV